MILLRELTPEEQLQSLVEQRSAKSVIVYDDGRYYWPSTDGAFLLEKALSVEELANYIKIQESGLIGTMQQFTYNFAKKVLSIMQANPGIKYWADLYDNPSERTF